MKSISVTVSEDDYEAFRVYAHKTDRSIAELIRDAMALYRQQRILGLKRLERVPTFPGPKPVQGLPTREELWDEVYSERSP